MRMSPQPHRRLRLPLACTLGMLLCAVPTALAQSSPGGAQAPSTAGKVIAALQQCVVSVQQSGRSATFSGQMAAIDSAQRMAMRINVQERTPGEGGFRTIQAPGLGIWRDSEAGVGIYKYLRQVTNLAAPGEFRAVIDYRWLADGGHLIRQTTRHTQPCQQPDERPKLTVAKVIANQLGESTSATYQILIRNEGHGAAAPFALQLAVDGVLEPQIQVGSLAPGTSATVNATAPICEPGAIVEATPDPTHQIEEAPGGGIATQLTCPLPVS
jgi:hypothetical protein